MTCSDCKATNLTVAVRTDYATFCRHCAFIPPTPPKTKGRRK